MLPGLLAWALQWPPGPPSLCACGRCEGLQQGCEGLQQGCEGRAAGKRGYGGDSKRVGKNTVQM